MGQSLLGGQAKANASSGSGGTAVADVSIGITGGSAFSDLSSTASNNTVTISGGTVNGTIIGGSAGSNNDAFANNNTVTLEGSVSLDPASSLFGGYLGGGSTYDVFTGNTLNLKTPGLRVTNVANFEKLNFFLPSTWASTAHSPPCKWARRSS